MTTQLPEAGAPLVLADGTRIDPSNGRPQAPPARFVEIPNGQRAQEIVGRTRRRVADLPEAPSTMNAVSVVLAYTMFGLSPQEIAIATNLSTQQIAIIRDTEAYSMLEREIVNNILDADAENVQAILAEASHNAARRVTGLLDSDDETIQLAASKEVLNRTGHGSKDDMRRSQMAEGLNIVVTVRDESNARPTIDINGETV